MTGNRTISGPFYELQPRPGGTPNLALAARRPLQETKTVVTVSYPISPSSKLWFSRIHHHHQPGSDQLRGQEGGQFRRGRRVDVTHAVSR